MNLGNSFGAIYMLIAKPGAEEGEEWMRNHVRIQVGPQCGIAETVERRWRADQLCSALKLNLALTKRHKSLALPWGTCLSNTVPSAILHAKRSCLKPRTSQTHHRRKCTSKTWRRAISTAKSPFITWKLRCWRLIPKWRLCREISSSSSPYQKPNMKLFIVD
jgi:hypothetical protein